MQPILPTQLILPNSALRSRGATWATDDEMEHRRPHLVWANGETLETSTPTLGTALVQYGLKEWLGADGGTKLRTTRGLAIGRRSALDAMGKALKPVLDDCEARNAMPVVICSEVELAAQWLSQRVEREHCMLMAVGAPYTGPAVLACEKWQNAWFPLQLRCGPEAAACIWLGAPDRLATLQLRLAAGLRIDARLTTARRVPEHLAAAQLRVYGVAPATLACLIFIDDLRLQHGSTQGLPAEVFAASLRWLQAQVPWVPVFIVSHERVTAAGRPRVAELARQLGGALLKHRGLQRGGWRQEVTKQDDAAPRTL